MTELSQQPDRRQLLDQSLDLIRQLFESLAVRLESTPTDEWLGLPELKREYSFSRSSLVAAAKAGLQVHRGPRERLMVRRSSVEAWLASRPWKPPPRKGKAAVPGSLEAWEQEQERELRLLQGGRR